MRVFVAVELASTSREAVGRCVASLGRLAAFSEASVKWVATSNLHITLRFLGEVPASGLARVGTAVESPFQQPAFYVTLDSCGLFPNRGAPRVVWLGVRAGHSQLCALHDEVAGRLKGCGHAVAARPFRPHVTVGRVKQIGHAEATQVRTALETIPLAVPSWRVGRVVLYESRLSRRGPTYHVLTSGRLGDSTATGHSDPSRAY